MVGFSISQINCQSFSHKAPSISRHFLAMNRLTMSDFAFSFESLSMADFQPLGYSPQWVLSVLFVSISAMCREFAAIHSAWQHSISNFRLRGSANANFSASLCVICFMAFIGLSGKLVFRRFPPPSLVRPHSRQMLSWFRYCGDCGARF